MSDKVTLTINVDYGSIDWAREMYRQNRPIEVRAPSGLWVPVPEMPTNSRATYRLTPPKPEPEIAVKPHTAPWALYNFLKGKNLRVTYDSDTRHICDMSSLCSALIDMHDGHWEVFEGVER